MSKQHGCKWGVSFQNCFGRTNLGLMSGAVSSNVTGLKLLMQSLCNIWQMVAILFWNETLSDVSLCCKSSPLLRVLYLWCFVFRNGDDGDLPWFCCGLKTRMREWNKIWIYHYFVVDGLSGSFCLSIHFPPSVIVSIRYATGKSWGSGSQPSGLGTP